MARTDETTVTLTLADLEDALRSALRGLFPGRQKQDQMTVEMRKALPNFRRMIRSRSRA